MTERSEAKACVRAVPPNGQIVLLSLILVAAVANLNLSVANVALPSIGAAFDSSPDRARPRCGRLLAGAGASVLWLGALGDRYGRKLMLLLGHLAVDPGLLVRLCPVIDILFLARLVGGVSAGMAYPTTLALIKALGPALAGRGRSRCGRRWAVGSPPSARSSRASCSSTSSGARFPRHLAARRRRAGHGLAQRACARQRDHRAGRQPRRASSRSLLIGALILGINFAPVPNMIGARRRPAVVAVASGVAFVFRQRRALNPLYDLVIAARRVPWVAALAGIIVFGSLMGAMFIGQQYLQNVQGYSTLQAGAAIIPAALRW